MYKATINTNSYKNMRCSKKTWEKGTVNNFMAALNGWSSIEKDMQEVRWRIETFAQNATSDCWNKEKGDYSNKFKQWKDKPENKLTYLDVLCEIERTTNIQVYGFAQGYFSIDNVIKELEETGKVKILFKWCYDSRQYLKNYNGCYMEIIKI